MILVEDLDHLKLLCKDREDHMFRIAYSDENSWNVNISLNPSVKDCWFFEYEAGDFLWASDTKLATRTDVGKALINKKLFFIK